MDEKDGPGVVALSIPARAEYIALCRLALTGLSQVRRFEPETLADLKLALTEACSNSIRHAYESGATGVVDIRYELNGEKLAVEVADEGGLGIAIIRALVDELDIGPRPDGRGSRLRFTKFLS